MLTIGLLGGMTSESSVEYYRIINETVRVHLGGIHSARSIMFSVDFSEIEHLMDNGKWDEILKILIAAAQKIEKGGADFLVICTNTMHKLADKIQKQIQIPILNIIDATAGKIHKSGFKTIGLLGTIFTMEQDFYRSRLETKHNLNVLVPEKKDRGIIHRVIVDELSIGKIEPASKSEYWRIIKGLVDRGAEGIILGCTEIPLLVSESEGNVLLFDTTRIHAEAAVAMALKV